MRRASAASDAAVASLLALLTPPARTAQALAGREAAPSKTAVDLLAQTQKAFESIGATSRSGVAKSKSASKPSGKAPASSSTSFAASTTGAGPVKLPSAATLSAARAAYAD